MNKFLIPVFLFCSVICLAGCGNKEEASVPITSPVAEEIQNTVEESINDSVVETVAEDYENSQPMAE